MQHLTRRAEEHHQSHGAFGVHEQRQINIGSGLGVAGAGFGRECSSPLSGVTLPGLALPELSEGCWWLSIAREGSQPCLQPQAAVTKLQRQTPSQSPSPTLVQRAPSLLAGMHKASLIE